MASSVPTELSPAQLHRLNDYLEAKCLELTKGVRKRYEPDCPYSTLTSYLTASSSLVNMILLIPPSEGVRTSWLLRVTGDIFENVPAYQLDTVLETVVEEQGEQEQVPILSDKGLERSTRSLNCSKETWDIRATAFWIQQPDTSELGTEAPTSNSVFSTTDRIRLRSLIISGKHEFDDWLAEHGGGANFDVYQRSIRLMHHTFEKLEPTLLCLLLKVNKTKIQRRMIMIMLVNTQNKLDFFLNNNVTSDTSEFPGIVHTDMAIVGDAEGELSRLWSLVCELSEQLNSNKAATASLQAQANALKGQAIHNGTGFALRRFNTDLSKEVFESELERMNAAIVIENQTLQHENKQLNTAQRVRDHARNRHDQIQKPSSQQHELNLTRTTKHNSAAPGANASRRPRRVDEPFADGLSALEPPTPPDALLQRRRRNIRPFRTSGPSRPMRSAHPDHTKAIEQLENLALHETPAPADTQDAEESDARSDWALEREIEICRLEQENDTLRRLLAIHTGQPLPEGVSDTPSSSLIRPSSAASIDRPGSGMSVRAVDAWGDTSTPRYTRGMYDHLRPGRAPRGYIVSSNPGGGEGGASPGGGFGPGMQQGGGLGGMMGQPQPQQQQQQQQQQHNNNNNNNSNNNSRWGKDKVREGL
ncbi:SIKE family [Rhizoctonia solani]|uniref:SIKE family n=1 Tax=Rhizoctonia solani TaxID=456999 RepID=A0A8H7IL81_9AGAM|nr:SIKE family [Rhizoctonia solani]